MHTPRLGKSTFESPSRREGADGGVSNFGANEDSSMRMEEGFSGFEGRNII